MKVSRAQAAPTPLPPVRAASRAAWNHRSSHDRAAGAEGHQGHFYWWRAALEVPKTPGAHKSTLTFDFNGGVDWRSGVEGVDTHVHSGIVSSWFVQPGTAENTPHVNPTSGCDHPRPDIHPRPYLYSVFLFDERVSGISSPFFIQKLSSRSLCVVDRLHCSVRESPSTGSVLCSEAVIDGSVKETQISHEAVKGCPLGSWVRALRET